jgi:hypothetical protein
MKEGPQAIMRPTACLMRMTLNRDTVDNDVSGWQELDFVSAFYDDGPLRPRHGISLSRQR